MRPKQVSKTVSVFNPEQTLLFECQNLLYCLFIHFLGLCVTIRANLVCEISMPNS